MILYRPVGLAELKLIADAEYRAFPPRLPEQPIFYPVLNFDYAAQIARDWNTQSRPFAGFVTQFEVKESYVSQFSVQVVGGREHQELWPPTTESSLREKETYDKVERRVSCRHHAASSRPNA